MCFFACSRGKYSQWKTGFVNTAGRGGGGGGGKGAKFSTCMHLIITVHLEPDFMIGQLVEYFSNTCIAVTVTNLTMYECSRFGVK